MTRHSSSHSGARRGALSLLGVLGATTLMSAVGATAAHAGPALPVGRGDAVVHVRTIIPGGAAPVTVDASSPWNSRTGTDPAAVSATRSGVGQFSIFFRGLGAGGGNAQIVQYQDEEASRSFCTISSWTRTTKYARVNVRCFDTAGAPTDGAEFDVMFTNANRSYPTWAIGGYDYLWSDVATFRGTRRPAAAYRFGGSGTPTVTKVKGAGRYTVNYPGQYEDPHPYVTAYGNLARYCNISGLWYDDIVGMHIGVACFDAAGHPADSRFSFTMSEGDPLGTTDGAGAMLWAPVAANTDWTVPVEQNHNYASANPNRYHSWGVGSGEIFAHLPGTATGGRRVVWAQALGTTGRRCQVVGAGEDVNDSLHGDWVDAYVDVQCSLPDGTWADAPALIHRWDRS